MNERFSHVLGKLGELETLVDQGFEANTSHFDTAMAAATNDLLARFASPPTDDEVEVPPEPSAVAAPTSTSWRNPFKIALLGLL